MQNFTLLYFTAEWNKKVLLTYFRDFNTNALQQGLAPQLQLISKTEWVFFFIFHKRHKLKEKTQQLKN